MTFARGQVLALKLAKQEPPSVIGPDCVEGFNLRTVWRGIASCGGNQPQLKRINTARGKTREDNTFPVRGPARVNRGHPRRQQHIARSIDFALAEFTPRKLAVNHPLAPRGNVEGLAGKAR